MYECDINYKLNCVSFIMYDLSAYIMSLNQLQDMDNLR